MVLVQLILVSIHVENLIITHNKNLIDSVDINIDQILIKEDGVSIMNLKLNQDNSILHATCQIDSQEINIQLYDSQLNHMDPLFELYDLKLPLRNDTINFQSSISIRQDSVNCNLEIMSGNSALNMDLVKTMDLISADCKSNLALKDL